MARIQGYRCDGPNCSTVTETESIPDGWITVKVHVSAKAAGLDPDKQVKGLHPSDDFHLCSNSCLAKLGKARYEAAREMGTEGRRRAGSAA